MKLTRRLRRIFALLIALAAFTCLQSTWAVSYAIVLPLGLLLAILAVLLWLPLGKTSN
ncbi:hypothetical protein [Verrucomicrobium sp. BvORR106]|uniref:hypothetical protein n=1 Tax=Verrucomicrobium sp. BvORR106 TaxID=1403819 RepID=UPI002240FC21|nr:hypothetical protein [Verrucomicrobium sp. BvORR106]